MTRHFSTNNGFIQKNTCGTINVVRVCESVACRRPATPSHNHGLCPLLGSQPAFLLFSTDIFTPHGLFPPQSGFSEFVVSSRQFCCTICSWEDEIFSPLCRQHFFCIDLSRMDFRCVHLFQLQPSYFLSKIHPRDQCTPKEYS